MSEVNAETKPKRHRTSRPKVKTGCFTCKVRRVKCDESKPECLKCVGTHRKCDGYPRGVVDSADQFKLSRNGQVNTFNLRRKPTLAPNSLEGLSLVSCEGSTDQHRSLQYFRECIVARFSPYQLDKSFWEYLVPQLSHALPLVRAGTSALSSLHELSTASERSDPFLSHMTLKNRQENFLKEYCFAIRKLQEDLKNQPHGFIPLLVTSVLLICVELLQGNSLHALQHLQGGLNVLQHCRTSSVNGQPSTSSSIFPFEHELDHLFRRLDLQASTYLLDRPPYLPMYSCHESHSFDDLTTFSSLQEASHVLITLVHACYHFTSSVKGVKYQSRSTISPALIDTQQFHLFQLESWLRCMERNLTINRLGTTSMESLVEAQRTAAVLTANCQSAYVYVATVLDPYETAYDYHSERFIEILDESTKILKPRTTGKSHSRPSESPGTAFTTEPGVIQPLYFVATRFRHSCHRRRAIELMELAGMEGPWDGYIMAKVAEKVIGIEELLCGRIPVFGNGELPEAARFHGIGVDIDRKSRVVSLTCSYLDAKAITWETNEEHDLRDLGFWRLWQGDVVF